MLLPTPRPSFVSGFVQHTVVPYIGLMSHRPQPRLGNTIQTAAGLIMNSQAIGFMSDLGIGILGHIESRSLSLETSVRGEAKAPCLLRLHGLL